MENTVDFDALSRQANESGGAATDLNKLFGATFALPKWYFIARGELPDVSPYIASNAAYAGGQQMIRAFTDSQRLHHFAKENNLTGSDGTAQILEIPTGSIVDWLEQFIAYGVHGIWFNSDHKSDGYFIPLKQLRLIKEHLAKINWTSVDAPTDSSLPHNSGFVPPADSPQSDASKTPLETIAVIINDGLMLPSGFFKKANYACNFYCLVPRSWTENGELKKEFLEKFYDKFYGAMWRTGNSDGSRYVVDFAFTNVLSNEDLKNADWTTFRDNDQNHYWFYVADENGKIESVKAPEFQQAFDAARQPPAAVQSVPKNSNLENWGLSPAPDGSVDLNIKIFRPGTVRIASSLAPFYSAIAPLLTDYQGSGDFAFIFNFAPEAIRDLTENFTSNDHGKYLRIRKFQYHPPNAVADAVTIDSNQLRHTQTGGTLSLSFALLQIHGNTNAALYFGMEGNRGEIEKLLKAITPALEDAEFKLDESK